MTPSDIQKLLNHYDGDLCFILQEFEHLKATNGIMLQKLKWREDEYQKLRDVAAAAEGYIELCNEVSQPWRMNDDLENALKAWKGDK